MAAQDYKNLNDNENPSTSKCVLHNPFTAYLYEIISVYQYRLDVVPVIRISTVHFTPHIFLFSFYVNISIIQFYFMSDVKHKNFSFFFCLWVHTSLLIKFTVKTQNLKKFYSYL